MKDPLDRKYELFLQHFVAHRYHIYMFIFALVANKADAEDVFQEVSTLLWRKFDQFEPNTNFRAWARQFARNAVLNYRRYHTRRMMLTLDDDLAETFAERFCHVQDQIEDEVEALRHCVTKLDDRNRELVQRLYLKSEPVRIIAGSWGVSVQRIYQRLGRVHKLLMHCVNETLAIPGDEV